MILTSFHSKAIAQDCHIFGDEDETLCTFFFFHKILGVGSYFICSINNLNDCHELSWL